MTKPIPDGFTAVTPYLMVDDADAEIAFLVHAFGAVETGRLPMPGGKIAHATVTVGGAPIMLSSAGAWCAALPAMVFVYVPDADAAFTRAVAFEGVTVQMPVADQFWGDRGGSVVSKNGVTYWIATHTEDVTPEQIAQRMAGAPPAAP